VEDNGKGEKGAPVVQRLADRKNKPSAFPRKLKRPEEELFLLRAPRGDVKRGEGGGLGAGCSGQGLICVDGNTGVSNETQGNLQGREMNRSSCASTCKRRGKEKRDTLAGHIINTTTEERRRWGGMWR